MNTFFAKLMTTVCTAALIFPASVFANSNATPQEKVSQFTRKLEHSSLAMNNQGMRFFGQSNSVLAQDELHPNQISEMVKSGHMKTMVTLLPYSNNLGAQLGVKVSSFNASGTGQILQIELMKYDSGQGKLLSFEHKIGRAIPIDYQTADATQIKLLIDQSSGAMYKIAERQIFAALSPAQKAKADFIALGKSISNSIIPTAHAMPEMPLIESIAMGVSEAGMATMGSSLVAAILLGALKGTGVIQSSIGKWLTLCAVLAVGGLILDLCVNHYLSNAQYGSQDKDDN